MALLARASGTTFQFSNNCFQKFTANRIVLKFQKKIPVIVASYSQAYHRPKFFKTVTSNKQDNKYVPYDDEIARRRDQAQRSILVQVQSDNSSRELHQYCLQYGTVKEMHHYVTTNSVNFILVEFKSHQDVELIRSGSSHMIGDNLPISSNMMWFRAAPPHEKQSFSSMIVPLTVKDAQSAPTVDLINKWMLEAETVSDQMSVLITETRLNDTDTRLRFLTARQVETSLSGIFPNISVLPFGSSVNGFGKRGCDLDLVIKLQSDSKVDTSGRLIYHTKAVGDSERIKTQKIMESIASIMQLFLPGISNIRRILHARVPILKYNQTFTGLECDLSMSNTTGVYMSELLYLYGELDSRVRPLIFSIRTWAKNVQLTNNFPGAWISNFSLTLLALFFLQKESVLPSLKYLATHARKSDVRIADGCVDCTFIRDISRLPAPLTTNNDSLETLLLNFFIYYSNFDFTTKAICLYEGDELAKPDGSVMYVKNPLERDLNVTKNLNVQETERLKVEMRNAAWTLDTSYENKNKEWGLLSLFQQKVSIDPSMNFKHSNRIIELGSLFQKINVINEDEKKTTRNKMTTDASEERANSFSKKMGSENIADRNKSISNSSTARGRNSSKPSGVNTISDHRGMSKSKSKDTWGQEWRR